MPQKRGSTRSRRWLEWSSTPAAASHLAAIRLLPDNSPSYRCSPPAVPRRRVQRAPFWADAGVAACAALLPREARIDSSTSAGSVDPHPTLAPSLRSRRVAPTSPLRSTTPPAGVIAPHACCETPQIAAANAPHPRVLIVSCRQASRPRHTVSAKLKCSHACLPETHDSLHRLRFSRQEAEEIAAVSGSARVRVEMDFAANRENALSAASSKVSVLHFATHALLDEKRPELSGIVLSLVGPDGRPRNGFLRLVDIYQWKINAQLVVLSACRTALGRRLENEGQLGLVRGFFYAGASDVLATLWSVDDRATAIFMAKFYQALLRDKLPPSTALRRAQNEIRDRKS